MRRFYAVSLLFAVIGCAPIARAQEAAAVEVYGGYDYVRYNANPRINGVPPSESYNGDGGSAQLTYNPFNWLGLVADLSGYAVIRQGFATTHQISYLFGPRINFRRGRVTPFAQALFGRMWAEDGITFGTVSEFGMTAGGGIDVQLTRHISIRPAQAEYFLTTFNDGNNNRQNNFRFSTGIVVRFGRT